MASEEAKEESEDKTPASNNAIQAEAQAKKQSDKESTTVDKKTTAELFKGQLTLSIMPPVDLGPLKRLEASLKNTPELRLTLIGGSVSSGTEMVVSMENAIPLVDILMDIPCIDQVNKKGKILQITLKSE